MAQEFAPKLPEGIPSKCDSCGSLPKAEDVGIVDPSFTCNELMYHVRCYVCGKEWID